MSQLTSALIGAPAASQRLQVAASASLAGALASGMQAAGRCIADGGGSGSLGLSASMCSPPRPATSAGYLRGSIAPSVCLAGGKTRRRKRGRPDGEPGGGGGDDGGGGTGSWYGPWGDEPEDEDEASGKAMLDADWMWRFCCIITALQTVHFLMTAGQPQRPVAAASASGLATLSQTFFAPRRAGLQRLPTRSAALVT